MSEVKILPSIRVPVTNSACLADKADGGKPTAARLKYQPDCYQQSLNARYTTALKAPYTL